MDKQRERIYVCHTFYHVYVACLKELNLPARSPEEAAGAGIPCGEEGDAPSGAPEKPMAGAAALRGENGGDAPDAPEHFTAGMPRGARRGGATLVLSRMSNDFGDLDVRARGSGLFEEVVWFDEKPFSFFEELTPLKEDTGSLPRNMANRMKFCRRYGQLEEPYVPVDFAQYRDIYVFCDSDPIGYYLSYKKIRYHAVEDGLDCIRYYDTARWDNRGHFALKAWMAARGFIFIQNGYGRYCIDMEVNDISALEHPTDNMVEVPREKLIAGLAPADRELLIRLFIANRGELETALRSAIAENRPAVLILTEPLCTDLAIRQKLFEDMIAQYGTFPAEAVPEADEVSSGEGGTAKTEADSAKDTGRDAAKESGARIPGTIVIKPHPRDALNYREIFPQHIVLDAKFPMEILNLLDIEGAQGGCIFARVVTVYTVPDSIHCAKEKIYLGNAWMDRYEDQSAHAHVTDVR